MLSKKIREFIKCVDVLGKDAGVENYSLEDLTLKDLSVEPKMGPTLGEHLPIYGSGQEIIDVAQRAKVDPSIYQAVREDSVEKGGADQKGTDKKTGSCQCRSCKAKKAAENK